MNTIRITTSQNIELDYDLASLGERILGYLIDGLILAAYVVVIMMTFIYNSSRGAMETIVILVLFPIAFYHLLCEIFLNGQSVGKKVMKIKVISLNGNRATLGQYLIRWIFRLIDFSLTSNVCAVLTVAISEKRQRLGDIVAGTAVIKTVPRTSLHETMYVQQEVPDYHVTFPEVERLSDKDMQLVKEVIMIVRNSGNTMLALRATEKIEATINISRGSMEPIVFLHTLLADYNYLTSR